MESVSDHANAVSLDESGNIYVTGGSAGAFGDYCCDYATVMYDPQWAARYRSPGTSDDEARAIAADRAGSVYITGYINDFRNGNTATIRYKPRLTDNEAEQD